ncbi:MAG: hypothetical protein LBC27_04600 [Spirochaetaceae bacterium]|jgi:hypothetical protein|nr:hypothetical protein [Spirochaetaceae bacterium]
MSRDALRQPAILLLAAFAIKGTANDHDLAKMHLFSKPVVLGYYAVNFKEIEIEPRKKIFGIF